MKNFRRRKERRPASLANKAILITVTVLSTSPLLNAAARPQTQASKPNVIIILLDDVGFGQLSPFGGPYRAPNIERLSKNGLRYTNFHTTALCSPTRAALLTGRNHHSVGMATITETASEQPGYNGKIPKSAGTLASMLKANGYDTYGLGKWHLTPAPEAGPEGPFDRWPTSMGFDHWYGFQGADTDQWSPGLWSDTTPVEPKRDGKYHLTNDLANHAISFLEKRADSDKPFFIYFAPGAGHAPHQAPKEWIEKNRGRFDEGWDLAREKVFQQQKAMGLFPKDAVLPARNEAIKAWSSLSNEEKKLFTRMQEVHAGFIEHTDYEIGRMLDALKKSGKMDNTLILVTADNGTSGEGGPFGSINEIRLGSGVPETLEENLARIDELGGPTTYNHYPAGWAQVGNTPFRYWKQQTHEGGVHDPMIVSWPQRIKDFGSIRSQFEHVTDVTPTILEAAGIEAPSVLDGVKQMPIEGKSMLSTFTDAKAPTAKKVQYFEMLGNRGIWADGWKAVAFHGRKPWIQGPIKLAAFEDDRWELYHVAVDPLESVDLAKQYPEKLEELKNLFDEEAKKYQVFPLDDSGLAERLAVLQSSFTEGQTSFVYDEVRTRVPESQAPWLKNVSHSITAEVVVPKGGAQGAVIAHGGRYSGYSLYIKDNKLAYSHNYVGKTVYTVDSTEALPEGPVTLGFDFERMPQGEMGNGGRVRLFVNGKQVADKMIENLTPGTYGIVDTFDIGSDTVTPVAPDIYAAPFKFNGQIKKVSIDIKEKARVEKQKVFRD